MPSLAHQMPGRQTLFVCFDNIFLSHALSKLLKNNLLF
jgi:hypothetical protein